MAKSVEWADSNTKLTPKGRPGVGLALPKPQGREWGAVVFQGNGVPGRCPPRARTGLFVHFS